MKTITLKMSQEEAQETYYALESKAIGIERGEYGPNNDEVNTVKWAKQLRRVAARINRQFSGNL